MGRRRPQDSHNGPCLHRLPKVIDRTGLGKTRIYELIAQGAFPRPVHIGLRSVAWPEDEVSAWVEAKIKASRRAAESD